MQVLKKDPRSPLRYAGGKSRGAIKISNFIPQETKTIHSPFFGGGSVELICANNGITVHGYDNFIPVVEFWQCLLKNPKKLAKLIKKYHPLSKKKFYELQKIQHEFRSKYERAAVFFVLNRSSFSGTTFSGGMSPGHHRFTMSSIEKIANFKMNNIQITHADFTESIPKIKKPNELIYLDPPYMIDHKLYGDKGDMHRGFDHDSLAELLRTKNRWILSYNNCADIHKLYDGYTFRYPEWKYGMSNDKNSREVLIFSHDLQVE